MTGCVLTLVYRDVDGAAAWLQRVFRFQPDELPSRPPKSSGVVFLRLDDVVVGLTSEFSPQNLVSPLSISSRTTAGCQVAVGDIEELYRHVVQQGAQVVLELSNEAGSEPEFACRDLEGHVWLFVAKRAEGSLRSASASGLASGVKPMPPPQPSPKASSVLRLVTVALVAAIGSSALTGLALKNSAVLLDTLALGGAGVSGKSLEQGGERSPAASDVALMTNVYPKLSALASDLADLNRNTSIGAAAVDKLAKAHDGANQQLGTIVSGVDEFKARLTAAESTLTRAEQKVDGIGASLERKLSNIAQSADGDARSRTDAQASLDSKLSALAQSSDADARKQNDALLAVLQKLDDLGARVDSRTAPLLEDREAKPGAPAVVAVPDRCAQADVAAALSGGASQSISPTASKSVPSPETPPESTSSTERPELARACGMAIRLFESTEQELKQARSDLTKWADEKRSAQQRERELQSALDREIKAKQYAWKVVADLKRRPASNSATSPGQKKQSNENPDE